MADPCLRIQDLTHSWTAQSALFRGFSASLKTGEITALVGLSGCGKSTLLKIAAGLLKPHKGIIEGHYSRSAMVFQSPSLLPGVPRLRTRYFPLN